MRQIVGGGGYFPQYITGNNDWQDVSFTFTANDNTSGMIEGFQHGGLVEDVFSFYIRDLKLEKVK